MAPTKPSKRTSIRTKLSRPISTTSTTTPSHAIIKHTKKSKLLARKTSFISKITKSSTPAIRRRRRGKPAPKQLTELDSLASALDDIVIPEASEGAIGGKTGIGKKSLKSRPGAMKRKEALVKGECERFKMNLAVMQAGLGTPPKEGKAPGPSSTWEALRGFIEGTMEKKEEFVKKAPEEKEVQMVM